MSKKETIAIFDLDGTLIPGFAGAELVTYFFMRLRMRPTMLVLTPVVLGAYPFGLISKPTMVSLGATCMEGVATEKIERAAQKSLHRKVKHTFFQEALDRIHWHHMQGHTTLIASGSPMPITRAIGDYLGIELAIGTPVEIQGGVATGRLIGYPIFGDKKAVMVSETLKNRNIDWPNSWSYANEIHDRTTLELVGHPVAVNPDLDLRKLALENEWEIMEWNQRRGQPKAS